MRIIDKFKDYYDYLSNYSDTKDTVVFDRRGSIPLLKSDLVKYFAVDDRGNFSPTFHKWDMKCRPLILCTGQKLFVFRMKNPTRTLSLISDYIYDAEFELLGSYWNYEYNDSPIRLGATSYNPKKINLKKWNSELVDPDFKSMTLKDWKFEPIRKRINENIFRPIYAEIWPNPILISSGIPSIIPAEEIYQGLEQYISSKKTEEKIESVGLTNIEKVINHGFDKKTSFRHPIK
jgi:hypothetical protein